MRPMMISLSCEHSHVLVLAPDDLELDLARLDLTQARVRARRQLVHALDGHRAVRVLRLLVRLALHGRSLLFCLGRARPRRRLGLGLGHGRHRLFDRGGLGRGAAAARCAPRCGHRRFSGRFRGRSRVRTLGTTLPGRAATWRHTDTTAWSEAWTVVLMLVSRPHTRMHHVVEPRVRRKGHGAVEARRRRPRPERVAHPPWRSEAIATMKYLEYPELEVLSRALTFEMSECKVFTRIEAYSCKAVNKEKRLFKSLESSYLLSASSSPPAYLDEALASPFGRLDQPSARKTLFLLIATLNGAFPDHDFSDVNPMDFVREASSTNVLNSLTSTLLSLRSGTGSPSSLGSALDESPLLSSLARSPISTDARPTTSGGSQTTPGAARSASASLPAVLDEIIQTSDCEVYTFHPDMDSDPHASAEPDEEGGEEDGGDPYDEGYDTGMVSGEGMPMMDEDVQMVDAPVFDEDMDGGDAALQDASTNAKLESPSLTIDEDDLAGAGAGLLWSTFAFFYNRRMKRILFISVWCRKNALGGKPALWSSPSLAPLRPANEDVPALSMSSATYASVRERPGEHRLTPNASPARHGRTRRPAPYSTRRPAQRARGRSASNSPAPSALSPFPHAQPQRAPPAMGARHAQPNALASERGGNYPSLDAAMLSMSAPVFDVSHRWDKTTARPRGSGS